jgi:thiosulfate reductase cytochrome b subunit
VGGNAADFVQVAMLSAVHATLLMLLVYTTILHFLYGSALRGSLRADVVPRYGNDPSATSFYVDAVILVTVPDLSHSTRR